MGMLQQFLLNQLIWTGTCGSDAMKHYCANRKTLGELSQLQFASFLCKQYMYMYVHEAGGLSAQSPVQQGESPLPNKS